MPCDPTPSVLGVQVAVRVLPVPDRVRAEHPLIDVPPSRKLTVPVGAFPVTLAVSVTLAPVAAGLRELASAVVVLANTTTCERPVLVEGVLLASPE